MPPSKHVGKTIAIALSAVVGAVAAVAQIADYIQSHKFNVVTFGIFVVAGVVSLLFAPEWGRRIRDWWARRGQPSTSGNPANSVALVSLVVIAAATATIAATGILALVNPNQRSTQSGTPTSTAATNVTADRPPTPTLTPDLRNPRASFRKPTPDLAIDWGSSVDVEGTVTYLGANSLWLVTKPQAGGGSYYLTEHSPITTRDGDWFYTDSDVGDATDKGKTITYLAIEANTTCADGLASAGDDVKVLPSGCTQLASVAIHVR